MKKVFEQSMLGPVRLRNRTIRSAAFEGMCPGGVPSEALVRYHRDVARGGVGMTTVAYVSVHPSGLSFPHQAWMSEENVEPFRRLTDAVHGEGAAAAVQLGHCGNMADRKVSGRPVYAPSPVFNLFGLVLPRALKEEDIETFIESFVTAADRAKRAGFDCVEIHGGHGYLLSQFLSPSTNRRKDRWGGSLENRYRFLGEVTRRVKESAGNTMAVVVKMNMRDGFDSGYSFEDALQVARWLEGDGADGLVLSGGFVSKTPMYVMRGETPTKDFIRYQSDPLIKAGLFLFGNLAIKGFPYERVYFLEDGRAFRKNVDIPLIYVGGVLSLPDMETVLAGDFDFIQIARALFYERDFVNLVRKDRDHVSGCLRCGPCNRCMGTMYAGEARCTFREEEELS
jgi:2,4-dienoyl-CoA reductase-like NADH-dependent reductase (Old Yellow Enzyme family)